MYKIRVSLGLKILTIYTIGLNHLDDHRFNYEFESCINLLCFCSLELELTICFFRIATTTLKFIKLS